MSQEKRLVRETILVVVTLRARAVADINFGSNLFCKTECDLCNPYCLQTIHLYLHIN